MQENTVIEGVWAWLFSKGWTKKVRHLPGGSTITEGFDYQEVERMTRTFLNPVVDEVMTVHDWDFACDEKSDATVADQAEYTLSGNNGDCQDIINVRYDTDEEVLEKLNVLENDRRKPQKTGYGIYGWTAFGRSDDKSPIIIIHNTPTEAKTFKYRYRKKDLGLGDMPDSFDFVVVDAVCARFDRSLQVFADRSLARMIARYTVGGDEIDMLRINPLIEDGNVRRCSNQGGM